MDTSRSAAHSCVDCGLCERIQNDHCGCPAGVWGSFAERIIGQARQGAIDALTERALFTCALCGACTAHCPAGINAAALVREGRAVFMELKPEAAERYRPMHVDLAGNVFSGLRAWRGVSYADALAAEQGSCESLFFPGCTLSTYAPDLAACVAQHLLDTGQVQGMTTLCCGNPLWGVGLARRCNSYAEQLNSRLSAHGVRRIVVGCPNCYRALTSGQHAGFIDAGMEICVLPQVLASQGVRIPTTRRVAPDARSFAVFDSCPDREFNLFGSAVRALLPEGSAVELGHAGRDTLCCGSGGMVGYYDHTVSQHRRAGRLEDFSRSGADCLVTSCTSCANSFVRDGAAVQVHHYLELVFDTAIDWQAHRDAIEGFGDAGGYDFAEDGDDDSIFA